MITTGACVATSVAILTGVELRYPTLIFWKTVICCAAAVMLYVGLDLRATVGRRVLCVVFGAIVLLFSPLSEGRLARSTWEVIDWVTLGIFVIGVIAFESSTEDDAADYKRVRS